MVAIFWVHLKNKSEALLTSSDSFEKSIGAALKEALERKDKYITGYHLAATMLYPETKRMLKFSDFDRQRVSSLNHFSVKEIVPFQAINTLKSVSDSYETEIVDERNPEPPTSAFDDMMDKNVLIENNFENELQRYQSSPEIFDPKDDLLQWWFNRKKFYPRLSKCAKKLLSVPASSTGPERSFSHVHNLITDKRQLLGPDTVSGLMLGGSY